MILLTVASKELLTISTLTCVREKLPDHELQQQYRNVIFEMASAGIRISQQAGLEVVPPETGLYSLPGQAPLYPTTNEATHEQAHQPASEAAPKEQAVRDAIVSGVTHQTPAQVESQDEKGARRKILGLSVPIFWTLIVALFIVLAAAIGGGVGGGLSAQQKSNAGSDGSGNNNNNNNNNAGDSGNTSASPSASPTPAPTSDDLVPTDGCPRINNVAYMPYSADGKAIPLQTGDAPQEFEEQCWTNWANTASTHDILRTYTPTLENCITVCAEYNKAYLANLGENNGVGGGPCLAVTIVKEHAGFCYLKNGTGTNDTTGNAGMYSSAILLTNVDDLL